MIVFLIAINRLVLRPWEGNFLELLHHSQCQRVGSPFLSTKSILLEEGSVHTSGSSQQQDFFLQPQTVQGWQRCSLIPTPAAKATPLCCCPVLQAWEGPPPPHRTHRACFTYSEASSPHSQAPSLLATAEQSHTQPGAREVKGPMEQVLCNSP